MDLKVFDIKFLAADRLLVKLATELPTQAHDHVTVQVTVPMRFTPTMTIAEIQQQAIATGGKALQV